MNFPHLNSTQFAVLMTDGKTGIVLLKTGEISKSKDDLTFEIFTDQNTAESYIAAMQGMNDTWEFVLYNHLQEVVGTYNARRWQ